MTEARELLGALAELGTRLGEARGVEEVVDVTLLGLQELLGLHHTMLLVHHVETDRLVTLASRGYERGGTGSEVGLGEGVIGTAAVSRRPMRIGNLQRMLAYARTVQRSTTQDPHQAMHISLPGLQGARSQMAAPMVARGALIGVIAAESETAVAFDDDDEVALAVVGHLAASAFEREQVAGSVLEPAAPPLRPATTGDQVAPAPDPRPAVRLRHYAVDGSTFLDDAYVIKGVAGRLLWKIASEHTATGRVAFTNREARLDPALELPSFRDNFESRLVLLKRRLEERDAPLRITRTGRGRFDVVVHADLLLERVDAGGATSTGD